MKIPKYKILLILILVLLITICIYSIFGYTKGKPNTNPHNVRDNKNIGCS